MRYILGLLLLTIGIAAFILCLTLRSQFHAIAVAPEANPDAYPLLEMVIPDPKPGTPPPQPADLARGISYRIYAIGVFGVLLIVAGLLVCIGIGPKSAVRTEA